MMASTSARRGVRGFFTNAQTEAEKSGQKKKHQIATNGHLQMTLSVLYEYTVRI